MMFIIKKLIDGFNNNQRTICLHYRRLTWYPYIKLPIVKLQDVLNHPND